MDPQPQEQQDISSKAIFALVLLTLVVSFLGAFVSIVSVSELSAAPASAGSGTSSARVSFEILPSNEAAAQAQVAFAIVDEP